MNKEQNGQKTAFANQLSEEIPVLSEGISELNGECLDDVAGGVFDPMVVKNVAKDVYQGVKNGSFSMTQSLGTHLPNSKFTAGTQDAIQGVYQHGKHIVQSVKAKIHGNGSTAG